MQQAAPHLTRASELDQLVFAMPVTDMPADPSAAKPFLVVLRRLEETRDGSFRPGANVEVTPALRSSGLLTALPADDLQCLLLVLTFAHPNGYVQPSLSELAHALDEPQSRTRVRLRRLMRFHWQGAPLLHELRRESGLHAYAPSLGIVGTMQAYSSGVADVVNRHEGFHPSRREAVLAQSRAANARPRDEVERDIAERNGWPWPFQSIAQTLEDLRRQAIVPDGTPSPALPPDTTTSITENDMPTNPTEQTEQTLIQHLLLLGVSREEAAGLLTRFDADRILRQVRWLPFRKANSPTRLLIAAIEGDYEVPIGLRRQISYAEPTDVAVVDPAPADLPLP
jgi:hypothetical protein